MSGSGRRRALPATPGSPRTRTGSTRRCSSEATTACCGAARGRPGRAWRAPPSATGTTRSAGRSSLACGSPATREEAHPMRTPADFPDHRIDSLLSESDERSLANDVLDGLSRPFKEIPPKHFYDARGSELFEQICDLPEYYPTRTERAILERYAPAIAERTGASELVELGAGYATKTRLLIGAMDLERFV